MPSFLFTFTQYASSILPWFVLGIVIAFVIERKLNPGVIKRIFGSSGMTQMVVAQIFGMISPLSIMSFLPVANAMVTSGANPGIIFSFFIAERAYDLQSFFIISSLFGVRFAVFNALAILLSLLCAAIVIKNQKVTFLKGKKGKKQGFIARQAKLLGIVLLGIGIGSFLRVTIPVDTFTELTGGEINGFFGGTILGFLLYFGPIVGNYPVAKSFADLGMATSGVFAFLTISPVLNLVVIMLFGGAVGYKNTYKAFIAYAVSAMVLTCLFFPLYS